MSQLQIQLEAGGLVLTKSKVDEATTEQIVARTYHHPALGKRSVVRLATDRLGKAEDLAMEFLGFEAPEVSPPIGIQQRRSLGFGAWALMNDPKNAQYALDLVKRMKAGARLAKSKPGHAWDAFTPRWRRNWGDLRVSSCPPYWEEVGRAYKDLGNQTYAGRALNKSRRSRACSCSRVRPGPPTRCRAGIRVGRMPRRSSFIRLWKRFADTLRACGSLHHLPRLVHAPHSGRHVTLGHNASRILQAFESGWLERRRRTRKVAGRNH